MSQKRFETKISFLGESCCGCGACAARCTKVCISMEPDAYGFLRPVVDGDVCVGCGACDAACPVLNLPSEDNVVKAFWAKANDDAILDRSSSGGMFALLACDVLSHGGIVAGAAWMDGCQELQHVVIECKKDLDPLMRSKYVQSSVSRKVYESIREALRAGRHVLFCGTACQVAGIRSYLGKQADSDLFFGVDVICHGVPSPEVWRRWIGYVEDRDAEEIHSVNFRSKITGWLSYSVMYEYIKEKDSAPRFSVTKYKDDWYMRAFLANASLRGSCFSCPFKRRCGSDITLGDYWGVQRQHPEVLINGGVSAVIGNTRKGIEVFSRISDSMTFGDSSFKKIVSGNPALVCSVQAFVNRDEFFSAFAAGISISEMMKRWDFEPSFRWKAISFMKRFLKRILRRD